MLILNRKVGERIIIGDEPDEIIVEVIEIRGSCVVLGFDAPQTVRILREEIVARISAENKIRNRTDD